MQIAKNTVVSIDYTLTNGEGQVLDTSKGRTPLEYIQGSGGLIPGLEIALEGKTAGETLKVSVPPEDAYGEKNPALIQAVPRANFGNVANIEVGMQFQARTPQGTHIVTIVGLEGDNVMVDANHPLAGQTLHFDVTIVSVREATEDDLNHGHGCHGDGSCENHGSCGGGCHE